MAMTPMNNADYLTRVQFSEEIAQLQKAVKSAGYTYEALAKELGVNKVWLTSAIQGQQWVPEEYCKRLAMLLKVSDTVVMFLNNHPYRGNTDPILYRLHEVLDTYGPAIKELIHEKGGNGIMSAIDFSLDLDIIPDPHGDRVVLTWSGKLLKYSCMGEYPW